MERLRQLARKYRRGEITGNEMRSRMIGRLAQSTWSLEETEALVSAFLGKVGQEIES